MPPAQARGHVHRRPLRADPAGDLLSPLEPVQPAGGRHEGSLPGAAAARSTPVLPVLLTQVRAAGARPCAISDHASPPVDLMVPGDADHLGPVERVERRAADQRGKQLQPVPAGPVAARFRQHGQRQGPVRHRCSPHTVRNAASKAGSCDVDVRVDLLHDRRRRPPARIPGDDQVAARGVQDSGREAMPERVRPDLAQPGALPRAAQHPAGRVRRPRLPATGPASCTSSIPCPGPGRGYSLVKYSK